MKKIWSENAKVTISNRFGVKWNDLKFAFFHSHSFPKKYKHREKKKSIFHMNSICSGMSLILLLNSSFFHKNEKVDY